MTPKQFIEKAIEGKWEPRGLINIRHVIFQENLIILCGARPYGKLGKTTIVKEYFIIEEAIIDPLAWQALGKVEGWKIEKIYPPTSPGSCFMKPDEWKTRMHRMVDALCEGKTIEQFIETL